MIKKTVLAAAISAALSVPAWAQSNFTETNMGFESGSTTGWTVGSNNTGTLTTTITGSGTGVSVITGSPGTLTFNSDANQAVGSPGSVYYQPAVTPNTWTFSAYGNSMLALQPNQPSITWSTVGAELGLTSAQITSLSTLLQQQATASTYGQGIITNLSYVYRTVSLTAGTTYRMAWNYIGTDYVPFNDGSITTLVPISGTGTATVNNYVQNYALLGFTNPGTGDYSAGTYGSTGWQVSTYTVDTTGDYKLGFAVFNLDDTSLSPVLLVDDLQGTTTKNGTTFGAVAPNPGTNAPVTSSPGSSPTLVSSVAGTPQVSTQIVNGATTTSTETSVGATITVLIITDTRTGINKVLGVNRNTQTNLVTPTTTVTTSVTPVTTTVTTTPVTVETYSDGSTATVLGTPSVVTSTANAVITITDVTNTVVSAGPAQDQQYTTRVDQVDYLSRANKRLNRSLDSDPLSRNYIRDGSIIGRTEQNAEQGVLYVISETQQSNRQDTYRMNTQRIGLGHEKRIKNDWLVGAHINQMNGHLQGDASGGGLDKTHVGLYSLYTKDDVIVKTDIGLSTNKQNTHHSIPELDIYNAAQTRGQDLWITNRIYAPEQAGFRPFVGGRIEQNRLNAAQESGAAVSAMTYDSVRFTKSSAEAGIRYEMKTQNSSVWTEVSHSTSGVTTVKAAAAIQPEKNSLATVNIQQQRQSGVINNILQVALKWIL